MPCLLLIASLLHFGRIVTHVEPYITSSKSSLYKGYGRSLSPYLQASRRDTEAGRNFHPNSTDSGQAEPSRPSYRASDHYRSLSSHFSAEEKELEDREYGHLKDEHAHFDEGTGEFRPATYTIDAVLAVPELFHENFLRRGEDHWETLMQIRATNGRKLKLLSKIKHLNELREERSKQYFSNSNADLPESNIALRESNIALRNEIKDLKEDLESICTQIFDLKSKLPNLLSPEVQADNVVVASSGKFQSRGGKPHFDLLDILSPKYVERAVAISGRGFSAYSGNIARLSRALVNFMLDSLSRTFGYREINVPLIVSESTLKATAHLPRFEEHLFKIDARAVFDGDAGYLIPTSEVPLLALHKNLRFRTKELPLWLAAYSECFRSEIQDYGLDTRGLIRQHQFGKVELLCLSDARSSDYNHRLMLTHIEFILNSLELPFRRVLLSEKDTPSTSSKTFDFEVYFPSLDAFVEVSSCSNTRDYQTSNLGIASTSREPLHAVNGSALAIGRTLSALLENNCRARDNGLLELRVPKALSPYLNEDSLIPQEPS